MTNPPPMTDDLVGRLRRKSYYREEWHEPHGNIDVPVPSDMAEWEGVQSMPVNPDGAEAAARIEALEAALRPFAEVAKHIGAHKRGIVIGYAHDNVHYEHFHAARAALTPEPPHAD